MYYYRQLIGFPPIFPPPVGPGGMPPGSGGMPPGSGGTFGPGGMPPGSGGSMGGPQQPPGPPPATPPPPSASFSAGGPQTFAVDPGALNRCLFRFTFIRLTNGESFWFYPTFIGRTSVAGYRWFAFRWVYFGIDTRRISSFQCV
ncbi:MULTISPECIES: hypothetical protein [Bacillus]|uniref:hypothetical protein n=1 Tax=Bacillus TaxID=1386 RepID=UPI000BB8532D|nr:MULTISPECIES: hypothetical protein [Bacillus]